MSSEFSDTNVVNAVQTKHREICEFECFVEKLAQVKVKRYLLWICGESPNQQATQNTALSFLKIELFR